jgi:hypothetical protein
MAAPPRSLARWSVQCAWCDGMTGIPLLPPEQVSHGICPACLRRLRELVEQPPAEREALRCSPSPVPEPA